MSVGIYVKESDLNKSLKDENLSKSNALFLDDELQPGFEVAKEFGQRRGLRLESIVEKQAAQN